MVGGVMRFELECNKHDGTYLKQDCTLRLVDNLDLGHGSLFIDIVTSLFTFIL
jgi:hypothetical protein